MSEDRICGDWVEPEDLIDMLHGKAVDAFKEINEGLNPGWAIYWGAVAGCLAPQKSITIEAQDGKQNLGGKFGWITNGGLSGCILSMMDAIRSAGERGDVICVESQKGNVPGEKVVQNRYHYKEGKFEPV